jgi:transposase
MKPYSNDLRERIVAAVERAEHSLPQLARLFAVSVSCIVRLLQRKRRTGSVQPKPHAGGPAPKLDDAADQRLRQLVAAQPDATLAELRDRLGIPGCLMTIARALRRLKITRKKKSKQAQQRDSPPVQAQRQQFRQTLACVAPGSLVFVDETGATTGMSRSHGRAPRGQRVVAAVPGSWTNVTLLVGLRTDGVVAPLAVVGAADGAVFQTYVEDVLVPQLRPGDVVVWDNLGAHQSPELIEAVEAAGALVEEAPPYSPDLSPIEEMFSKVKSHLRTAAARTTETVISAMGAALDRVTQSDILGWFHDRCAYAMPV